MFTSATKLSMSLLILVATPGYCTLIATGLPLSRRTPRCTCVQIVGVDVVQREASHYLSDASGGKRFHVELAEALLPLVAQLLCHHALDL